MSKFAHRALRTLHQEIDFSHLILILKEIIFYQTGEYNIREKLAVMCSIIGSLFLLLRFYSFDLCAPLFSAQTQYSLGMRYEQGDGVEKDPQKAFKYYKLSANQRFAPAQYNLGTCYSNGTGVQQTNQEAIKCYKLAADQGSAKAQFYLDQIK